MLRETVSDAAQGSVKEFVISCLDHAPSVSDRAVELVRCDVLCWCSHGQLSAAARFHTSQMRSFVNLLSDRLSNVPNAAWFKIWSNCLKKHKKRSTETILQQFKLLAEICCDRFFEETERAGSVHCILFGRCCAAVVKQILATSTVCLRRLRWWLTLAGDQSREVCQASCECESCPGSCVCDDAHRSCS